MGILPEFPFLQGRAFVFASQYAKLLPSQLAGQYLDAAVQVLEASEAGVPVKVSAVKAIHKYDWSRQTSVSSTHHNLGLSQLLPERRRRRRGAARTADR